MSRRAAALAAVAGIVLAAANPAVAVAISPPTASLSALEANPPSNPPEPTRQSAICGAPFASDAATLRDPSAAQQLMDVERAWQYSRGAGQLVAVIDTGVNPSSRFTRVIGGGDFVSDSTGLSDCDGHGTTVAGIIAARPRPDTDAFAGVAPEASILSIRQSAATFEAKDSKDSGPTRLATAGYGDVRTLAWAVVTAVKRGATVINISEVACAADTSDMRDGALGAALRYAYSRNVVVVAAAGNLTGSCENQNPDPNPARPDLQGWDTVRTIVSPAWYSDYLLTVGGVHSDTGQPWALSVHGPWVSVAAPATDVVSIGTGGRAVNRQNGGDQGPVPLNGTSFAAPYVAGLAALIKSRYPGISAREVMDRITRTAHGPGPVRDNAVGYGVIDPVAALTDTPPGVPERSPTEPKAIAAPQSSSDAGRLPKLIGLLGTLGCLVVAGVAWAISLPRRHLRRLTEDDY